MVIDLKIRFVLTLESSLLVSVPIYPIHLFRERTEEIVTSPVPLASAFEVAIFEDIVTESCS
jgi:hypothetical protein